MSFKKIITVEINGVEYEEEWELEFYFTTGEKAVMYYPNGDGHPGSPPEAELTSAELVERIDEDGKKVEHKVLTLEASDWLKRAGITTRKQEQELEQWAFEQAESAAEAAYDDAVDHEMDAAREEGRAPRHIRRRR